MLISEMIAFEQLSGENAELTSISRIGGFLDGYQKAMEKQQWIPCSEMLPMDKGVYLVTDDSGRVAWVEKSWFMWCDDGSPFWEYANVTAWMPLPEPYREEVSE